MSTHNEKTYRSDIDGLRAIAVLAVIFFHFKLLPKGYLGVDVFFVISGFLITAILYRQTQQGQLSIANFYLRRIRRILPTLLLVSLLSLCIGLLVMLPDDLENLAQSVIATVFFSNNILQTITTRDYWDVVNEFKPLIHTWSLGVEEQYYLFYPFLFLFIGKKRVEIALPILLFLTAGSVILFLSPFNASDRFYLFPFRFFELSVGGIAAIYPNQSRIHPRLAFLLVNVLLFLLIALLCFNLRWIPDQYLLILIVLSTFGILIIPNEQHPVSTWLLENKALVAIGKLSFSLYLWHQMVLAYWLYVITQQPNFIHLTAIFLLTFTLSVLTYFVVEQPFRNAQRIRTPVLTTVLSITLFLCIGISLYVYLREGIIRDVPELSISTNSKTSNAPKAYNNRVNEFDLPFSNGDKTKVLVIGNSFAKDWTNVLLESKYKEYIEISFIQNPFLHTHLKQRATQSDYIFCTEIQLQEIQQLKIGKNKVWYVGTKNFGINNGIHYNAPDAGYCYQRTPPEEGYLESNTILKEIWKDRYIDLISMLSDTNNTVPVFTPDCKFISQDCRHLTRAGAQYLAGLIEQNPDFIFNKPLHTLDRTKK